MLTYSSYLVRWWLRGEESQDQRQIFEIEHIQTGSRTRMNSLSEAEEWFESNCEGKVQLDEGEDNFESSAPASAS